MPQGTRDSGPLYSNAAVFDAILALLSGRRTYLCSWFGGSDLMPWQTSSSCSEEEIEAKCGSTSSNWPGTGTLRADHLDARVAAEAILSMLVPSSTYPEIRSYPAARSVEEGPSITSGRFDRRRVRHVSLPAELSIWRCSTVTTSRVQDLAPTQSMLASSL